VETGWELGGKVGIVFQKNHHKVAKSLINKGFIVVSSEKRLGATIACPFATTTPKMDISLFLRVIYLVFMEKIYPNLGLSAISENPIPTHSIFSGGNHSHPFPPTLDLVAKAPVFYGSKQSTDFRGS